MVKSRNVRYRYHTVYFPKKPFANRKLHCSVCDERTSYDVVKPPQSESNRMVAVALCRRCSHVVGRYELTLGSPLDSFEDYVTSLRLDNLLRRVGVKPLNFLGDNNCRYATSRGVAEHTL